VRRSGAGCALAVLALTLAASPAPASAAVRCTARGHAIPGVAHSRVIATGSEVLVYRTPGTSADRIWACSRTDDRVVFVGHDDSRQGANEEYGPTTTLGEFHLAGNWLLAIHETGAEEAVGCGKYAAYPCPGALDTLLAFNVARRAGSALASVVAGGTDAAGNVSPVRWSGTLLSPVGGVAWLRVDTGEPEGAASSRQTSSLYGCRLTVTGARLGCRQRLLAQGEIPAASLRLAGRRLSWSEAGQALSALLG
jgi:hypothetical protein